MLRFRTRGLEAVLAENTIETESNKMSCMGETVRKTVLNAAHYCSWLAFFLAAAFMFYFFAVLPVQAFCLAAASIASSWIVLFAGYGLWKTETWQAEEIEKQKTLETA